MAVLGIPAPFLIAIAIFGVLTLLWIAHRRLGRMESRLKEGLFQEHVGNMHFRYWTCWELERMSMQERGKVFKGRPELAQFWRQCRRDFD